MAYLLASRSLGLAGSALTLVACGDVTVEEGRESPDAGFRADAGFATDAEIEMDGTESANRDALTSACVRYVRTQCTRRADCFGQADTCFEAAFRCPEFLFSPGSTRTLAGTLRCAREFETISCEDFEADRLPDCVSPGTRTRDEPCIAPSQCESELCTSGSSCGVCLARVGSGAPCDLALDVCPIGEYCIEGRCSAADPFSLPKDGEPCSERGFCENVCRHDSRTGAGTCAPYAAIGEACGTQGTDHIPCGTDAYCDKTESVCRAIPVLGEPCGITTLNDTQCEDGARCLERVCTAYGKIGEACEPDDLDKQCEGYARCECDRDDCTRYVCVAVRFATESCAEPNTVCDSGTTCVEGTCRKNPEMPPFDELCDEPNP